MMRRPFHPGALSSRARFLGVLLALVTTSVQFAVPFLDGDLAAHTPVVESDHAPGHCAVVHDHAACLRLGASPWAPSSDGGRVAEAPDCAGDAAQRAERPRKILLRGSSAARAPPSIS